MGKKETECFGEEKSPVGKGGKNRGVSLRTSIELG